MDHNLLYHRIYALFESVSPLRFDCGRLCGSACCQPDPELPGMYLFPGEEALFTGRSGFKITETDLAGYGPVPLLSCKGNCERAMRPLSCRVFPLAPKLESGIVSVRPDPRGRACCPLCRQGLGSLSSEFKNAVLDVFQLLAENPSTQEFILALSKHLDEFDQEL